MADHKKFKLYNYDPVIVAAIIFAVLFLLVTIYQAFKLFQKRTWYFIAFLIGGIFEVLGYAFRERSAAQTPNWTTGPFIGSTLFALLAPTLFAASIYMILGRIIRLTGGEEHSMVRVTWLTKIFVGGDVLSFLVQGAGGGILSNAKTAAVQKNGSNLITGGLFIQIVFFGFFIIVAALFHRRITNRPTVKTGRLNVPWQKHLFVLYGASTFILIRSIYRVADYAGGVDSALTKSEAYFYVFDGTLMFLTMVLFCIWHPSEIINRDSMAKDGWASSPGVPLDGHSEESLYINSRQMGPRSMA